MEALERSTGAEHCCWNPPWHSKASVNVGSGVYWLGRALAGRAPHLPAKYHVPTQDGERERDGDARRTILMRHCAYSLGYPSAGVSEVVVEGSCLHPVSLSLPLRLSLSLSLPSNGRRSTREVRNGPLFFPLSVSIQSWVLLGCESGAGEPRPQRTEICVFFGASLLNDEVGCLSPTHSLFSHCIGEPAPAMQGED